MFLGQIERDRWNEKGWLPWVCTCVWEKVFKIGLSKFCGREPLRNLLSPSLNTLSNFVISHIYFQTIWSNFLFFFFRSPFSFSTKINTYPAGIYLLKVSKINTRARYGICSKLTIKTPEWHEWHRSGVFIVNFEHISHLALVFMLLTLNM